MLGREAGAAPDFEAEAAFGPAPVFGTAGPLFVCWAEATPTSDPNSTSDGTIEAIFKRSLQILG